MLPTIGVTGHRAESARSPGAYEHGVGEAYVRAVELAKGAPVILPPSTDEQVLRSAFSRLDGLLLTGGGDVHPDNYGEEDSGLLWLVDEARDRAELAMARWALAEGTPVLAICRGIQVLNVASGGSLYQDIGTEIAGALQHPTLARRPMAAIAHTVEVVSDTWLARVFGSGPLEVNSAHHQAARTIGSGLVVTARAPDGVVEGLENPDLPFCVGVQWHPEAMIDERPAMRGLFTALVAAAHSAQR